MYDVIIIGAGPGGMSAALYASRANLKTLLIDGGLPGGQMNNTESLDNYLGTPKANAPELAEEMYEQAMSFGAEEEYGHVTSITRHPIDDSFYFEATTATATYQARAVIVATGTKYKKLPALATTFEGKGVSYCAVCDGPLYKNESVAVIGGGDSALEEADYLTQFAETVHLIHRRDDYRAKAHLQERVKNNPAIVEHTNRVVLYGEGESTLDRIHLKHTDGLAVEPLPVSGAFVYIGSTPQTTLLSDFGVLSDEGYVYDFDPHTMMTSIPGLFAVGDIIDKPIRQVANAVGEGALAGQSVYNYLKKEGSIS